MTSRIPTIVVNAHTPLAAETFSRIGSVVALPSSDVTPEAVRHAEILIVRSETRVDAALLEGSAVRFVGTVTIGTDHVDLAYLVSRGIAFASAPGSNSQSVAEYVAAALLTWAAERGESLRGKTLGVVGVGNVGARVARVGRILGMNVVLNDPPLARTTGDPAYRPLDELMDADLITLHVPLTKSGPDATHHLFGEERLGRMKTGAVLINTSRGAVADTQAVCAALSSGRVSAAILDVWEREPAIDAGLLRRALIGTPHIAGYSLDGKLNAVRIVCEAACRYLGVGAEWVAGATQVPARVDRIAVPPDLRSEQGVLHFCVNAGYNIRADDQMLRGMLEVPEVERSRYFSRLRAEYRTRREFSHHIVNLSQQHSLAQQSLGELGFFVQPDSNL